MMNLALCSLASGSSGNCYVIRSGKTAVLADAGISAKQINTKLQSLGMSLEDIQGIVVTHEHSDHIKSIGTLVKKTGACIYSNQKTLQPIEDMVPQERRRLFNSGDAFEIGDISVKSFSLSHDAADPVGYSFSFEGKKIVIVTDTGCITEEIYENMKDSDLLVLESNHDENILRVGRYPWFLKQRILGEEGHLSNETAALGLVRLLKEERENGQSRHRVVLLAHLSKENNFPEMALTTVENILEENGFRCGRDISVEVLSRTEMSSVYWM